MKIRRIVFMVLWLLSLIGISYYGGSVSYGFFFALTLLPLVSLIYLGVVYAHFRIYQELESWSLVCDQPIGFFFTLPNEDYFAFASVQVGFFSSFSTVEKLPENPEYELLPGEQYTYETRLVCKYRGEYEVGVKEVKITDFFHLFSVHYHVPTPLKAVVLPKVIEVSALRSIQGLDIYMQKENLSADTEPDCVVREYVPGDPIKQIHWKATAKTMQLKVRDRVGEERERIGIFFDTGRYSDQMHEYLPLENKLLEVVLALGMFFVRKNIGFTVSYDVIRRGDVISAMSDFEQFYEQTREIGFDGEGRLSNLLQGAMERKELWDYRLLFLVTQKLSEDILQLTEEISKNGQYVVVYVIGNENVTQSGNENHERRSIVMLYPDTDLEGGL